MLLLFLFASAGAAVLNYNPYPQFRAPAQPCQFRYGQWSACSVSCGSGIQTRFVEILSRSEGCPAPVQRRHCILAPCLQAAPAVGYQTNLGAPHYHQQQDGLLNCLELGDGLHEDPKSTCSKVFYSCSNGKTFTRNCPEHLFYDKESKTCEQYQYVPACSGNRRPSSTPPPAFAPTPKPEFDCTTKEDGLYEDPFQDCVYHYYVCSNGITSKMECSQGLVFDLKHKDCVSMAKCRGLEPYKPVKKIPERVEPAPVPIDCTNPEFNDKNNPDPETACSERFFTCANKIGYEKWCPTDTFFDKVLSVCDIFRNVEACSGRPRPPIGYYDQDTPKYVIMQANLGSPIYHDYNFDIRLLKTALASALQVDTSLITEIELTGTTAIQFTASYSILETVSNLANGYRALHLVYNGQTIEIVDMHLVRAIDGHSKPLPVYPFDCEKNPDGNYEAGTCEDHYWSCIGGTTQRQKCPSGTKYMGETDLCEEDQYHYGCGGSPRTTPPPTTRAPQAAPVDFDCERLGDGHYTKNQCSRSYFTCSNGAATETECPGKTYYWKEKKRCEVWAIVPDCNPDAHLIQRAPVVHAPSSYHQEAVVRAPATYPQAPVVRAPAAYNPYTQARRSPPVPKFSNAHRYSFG